MIQDLENTQTIKERTERRINLLRCIRGKSWGASSKLILTTYKTLIRSIIDYAPFLTLILANSNYMILERIQRKAVRTAVNWPIKTSTQTIYEQINFEDIKTRAIKLTDDYINNAMLKNKLIIEFINRYNTCQVYDEGFFCKTEPRTTIFGEIKQLKDYNCSKHFNVASPQTT